MSRPTDWHVLDLDRDPTPGSPVEIRRMARAFGEVADDAEYAEGRIAALMGDDAIGRWIGEGGDAFRDKTGDLPEQLRKAKNSYRMASDALTWWANRLDIHQGDADAALVRGRAARTDLEEAQARASAAEGRVSSAAGAEALQPQLPGTNPDLAPTQVQIDAARNRLATARGAQNSANADVEAAQSRLDAARQLALDAAELRNSDGDEARRRINEASDAGIPERSRWDKFKDWAADAWDVIVTIAKVVVAVLGVVALIIGGPIAWIVFAAALVLLADALMKYANGEGSLLDVGLAALGCIPGTRGLTTLAALRNARAANGLLGAGRHILTSGRTAISGMANGLRGLTTAARTRVTTHILPLGRGLRAMSSPDAFGVLGTIRRLPQVLRIPAPNVGDDVYRIFGPALDANGLPIINPSNGYPMGSRIGGQSWTPLDPRLADDFRVQAGLPHENPGSYFVDGQIIDPAAVQEIRLGLPLDGNPGGWPEYIITDSIPNGVPGSVNPVSIGGVNEPWTLPPGGFTP